MKQIPGLSGKTGSKNLNNYLIIFFELSFPYLPDRIILWALVCWSVLEFSKLANQMTHPHS